MKAARFSLMVKVPLSSLEMVASWSRDKPAKGLGRLLSSTKAVAAAAEAALLASFGSGACSATAALCSSSSG